MAVPASNFGLQRLRQDFDLSAAGAMDDEAIRYRNNAFTGGWQNGQEVPISMMTLANSAGCIQPIKYNWAVKGNRNASARDYANSQYMSRYSVDVPQPSVCLVEAVHRGQASTVKVATISRHYAYIEGGGQIRVEFKCTRTSGGSITARVEILGSSTGYLSGTNEYLRVLDATSSNDLVINVPANRQFVSVMLQCNVDGQTNSNIGGIWQYSNLKITKL